MPPTGAGAVVPPGDDEIWKRLATLDRQMAQVLNVLPTQENLASLTIQPTTGHTTTSNFSFNTTPVELLRLTFTPPDGMTRALVFGSTSVTVQNLTGNGYGIDATVDINGASTAFASTGNADSITYGFVSNDATTLLTGLDSSTPFYVRSIVASHGFPQAASTLNKSNLDAMVLYLR